MRTSTNLKLAVCFLMLGTVTTVSSHADEFGSFRRGTTRKVPKAAGSNLSVDAKRQWLKQQVMKVEDPLRRFQLLKQVAQMSDAQIRQVISAYQRQTGAQPKSPSENRRGLAHFAESAEQNVPAPFSAQGRIGSKSELAQARQRLRQAQAYRDYLLRLRQQQFAGNGTAGFHPVITTLPSGVSMGASAVVSPDRRYVRVSVTPFFSQVGPVRTFNLKTGKTRVVSP